MSRMGLGSLPSLPAPRVDAVLLDQWPDAPTRNAHRLTPVGLSDPIMWAMFPAMLSVGQRARLELAMWLAGDFPVIVVDEWLGALDRVTARAVAWATGRALRAENRGAILLTAQDDIADDLHPDYHIQTTWSGEPNIDCRIGDAPLCSIHADITIAQGSITDWKAVKHLHYAAGDPATIKQIWTARMRPEGTIVGVVCYSYPDLHSVARNLATDCRYQIGRGQHQAQLLNAEVAKLSRMVVLPEYRGIGLAGRLIAESVPNLGCRYVECVTALGNHSQFLSHSGFREVPQSPSDQEAEMMDFAAREGLPPSAALDSEQVIGWIDQLSVRKAREARQLIWQVYHHLVLYRRSRKPVPRRVADGTDPRWGDAIEVVTRRLADRPSYWLMDTLSGNVRVPDQSIQHV